MYIHIRRVKLRIIMNKHSSYDEGNVSTIIVHYKTVYF